MNTRAIGSALAIFGILVAAVVGLLVGYSFLKINPVTVTSTTTSYVTTTSVTTVIETVAPSGSQTWLNAQSEVIPSGDSYLHFTYTVPYAGTLTISYTSTNNIHWSYTLGSTSISTPSSSSESDLTLPVSAGSLTLYMNNDNCNVFGCGSNSAVVTLTYSYG